MGLVSRGFLFISGSYVELSPLTTLGIIIILSTRKHKFSTMNSGIEKISRPAYNDDQLLVQPDQPRLTDARRLISSIMGTRITQYIVLASYIIALVFTLSTLLFSRSIDNTDFWSVADPKTIYGYFISMLLIIFLASKYDLNYKHLFVLSFIHTLLTLSVLPIIFDPIFGGDTVWFTIAQATTIKHTLPNSELAYGLYSLYDGTSFPFFEGKTMTFLQIIPRTSVVIFSSIFGIDHVTTNAWINPILASIVLPVVTFVMASLVSNRKNIVIGISFLSSPLYFIFGLSVGWSMGMGVILFALSFAMTLVWMSKQERVFLSVAILVLFGTLLTHPISGIFNVLILIVAIGYVYLWKKKNAWRLLYFLVIISASIVFPILPPLYFGTGLELSQDALLSKLQTSILGVVGLDREVSVEKWIVNLIFPAMALISMLLISFRKEKISILQFSAHCSLIIALAFIIDNSLIKDPPVAGRELNHLYVVLLPLTINSIVTILNQFERIGSRLLRSSIVMLIFALIFTSSFVFAYPESNNRNGRLIPLEIEAATMLEKTGFGKFAVISDFNNIWAGESVYGVHNPDAYYFSTLSYPEISYFYNTVFTDHKKAINELLHSYKGVLKKDYSVENTDIDTIFVILSSYRVVDLAAYDALSNYLISISLWHTTMDDAHGNKVGVYKIYDHSRHLDFVPPNTQLEQKLTLVNYPVLMIKNTSTVPVTINKIVVYAQVHDQLYNLVVIHNGTLSRNIPVLPQTIEPTGVFSLPLTLYPSKAGLHQVFVETDISYMDANTSVNSGLAVQIEVLPNEDGTYTIRALQ